MNAHLRPKGIDGLRLVGLLLRCGHQVEMAHRHHEPRGRRARQVGCRGDLVCARSKDRRSGPGRRQTVAPGVFNVVDRMRLSYWLGELVLGDAQWQPHVVVDGLLITGQNPASSKPAAKALLGKLRAA